MTVKITKPQINVREELNDLKKPTGIAGEAMLRAETPQEQFNLIGAGRRNMIINGDMRIAQRGTSQANVTTNGYFTVDRWAVEGGGQLAFDTSQVTSNNPDGFPCSIKISRNSAGASPNSTDAGILTQKIEASTLTGLGYGTPNAKSMTLSFYVKASMVGKYALNLYASDSGAARIYTHTYTVDAVGEWKKIEITVPPDSAGNFNNDNGIGMYLQWFFRAGSARSNGTNTDKWLPWVSANYSSYGSGQVDVLGQANSYFQITGVQLELGKVATPFEHRSYGEELALCQRYFEKSLADSIAASTVTTTACTLMGVAFTSTLIRTQIEYKVSKRATPTVTTVPATSGGTGSQWAFYNGAWNGASTSVAQGNQNCFSVDVTASGVAITKAYLIDGNWYADAEL